MQIIAAILIVGVLAAFIVKLNLIGRKETKRRAALAPEDRRALDREDAIWSQRFGF